MPAIAIVGAVAAVGFAAADVAAVGLTIGSAFAIAGAVGATLGAVGSVTKNKALSTAGMILGGIGAVGGIASAAGLFSSAADAGIAAAPAAGQTTSAFGGVTSDAANAATYGTQAAFDTGNAVGAGAGTAIPASIAADNASAGMIDFVAQPPPGAAANGIGTFDVSQAEANPVDTLMSKIAPQSTPQIGANSSDINTAAQNSGLLNNGTDTTAVTNTSQAAATPNTQVAAATNPVQATAGNAVPLPQGPGNSAAQPLFEDTTNTLDTGIKTGSANASSGIFSKILDFTHNNPLATYGLLQTAGSFLSGATNQLTPAQIAQLNSQANANNAAAALTQLQTRNLSAPKAVASTTPVTGTPQTLVPPTVPTVQPVTGVPTNQLAGLINSTPRLAPVTGVPA